MIQIQTTAAFPIIYQIDNSFNQPTQTGAVQWNGTFKRFEVSTGTGWMCIDNAVKISQSSEMDQLLQWAKKKMSEEQDLARLAENNSAIKDLVERKKEIESQLHMVNILIK